MTEDDLLQKILKLTNDLNIQQQTNQDIASGLKSQVNEFKNWSSNSKDSHELDIDSEDFLPELLPVNIINTTITTNNNDNDTNSDALADITSKHTKLLQEHTYHKSRNRELEQECAELQDMIHQYESSLELITGKLRTCSATTSEGQVQLRREYEALLDAEKGTTVALFMENVFLQSQLQKLSGILRNSYEEKTTMASSDTQIQQLAIENEGLRTMLAISDQQSSSSTSTSSLTYNQAMATPSLQNAKPSSDVIQEYFEGDDSSISSSISNNN